MDLCVFCHFDRLHQMLDGFVFKYFLNEFRKWILLLFIIPSLVRGHWFCKTILYCTYICLIQNFYIYYIFWCIAVLFLLLSTNEQCYDIISGESSLCQLLLGLFAVDYKHNCLIFWNFLYFFLFNSLTRTSDFIRVITCN